MANIVIPITLSLTFARTFLVADAINGSRGRSSIAVTVATKATSVRSPTSSTSQWTGGHGQQVRPSGAGSPKAGSLHLKLLAMHAMAIICQGAGMLKYALPVTVNNCTHTHRVKVAFTLFYDMALVVFLLAKVGVTNGDRPLVRWEKVVIWLSQAYAWVYLPLVAIIVSSTFPSGISTTEEGTFCDNSFTGETDLARQAEDNAAGYGTNNATLVVQFGALFFLFVKPLLGRLEGSQAGSALYRKVVIRNLVCTALICFSYALTTIVMVSALLRETPEDNMASHFADSAPLVNQFVTLCLTEIALPLGFSSCIKACSVCCVDTGAVARVPSAARQRDEVSSPATFNVLKNSAQTRIIPVQMSP